MVSNDNMLLAADVRKMCGGVSDMMIWRWTNQGHADFPQPIYVGRRRFWREEAIAAWWNTRESANKPSVAQLSKGKAAKASFR